MYEIWYHGLLGRIYLQISVHELTARTYRQYLIWSWGYKTLNLAGHFTQVGDFIDRAAALKRKSYEALSGSVYGFPDFAFHPLS